MSSREREILLRDSRSENMLRRLIDIPSAVRAQRQRRLLIATSGCIQRCPREPAVDTSPNRALRPFVALP